ncbi:PAS domain-containing protein [Paracoccus aminophilus]|uniref:Signal transduction histidine kinase n=1 Tax=Paracoccus aminophilus JCM 7686 TaxID=1367847 RepID=S5YS72_PARAH|nr:PAS domain-containing protein [Paracoccus aminophilus]AGT08056.1 signal transduction histidine kinase [Paracoccus aminophilus JCM 7686]
MNKIMSSRLPGASTVSLPASGVFRMEDAAGSNAALALALLRALPDSVYLMDPDGRVTFMNRAAAACLEAGLAHPPAGAQNGAQNGAGAPHGRFWWELWPEAPVDQLKAQLAQSLEGDFCEFEAICPGAGGWAQLCAVTLAPIEDMTGQITKLLCIARVSGSDSA